MAAKGVTDPGSTPRCSHGIGRCEREPCRAEALVQALQGDRRILQRHDQIEVAALVAQEQVLGVASRDLAAQRLRLVDGEQRRMGHGGVRDAEPIEQSEQVGGRGRHGEFHR
jgi:hypothetical protein